ncbi:hypothetical protein A7M48_23425 [Acinetobacter baumannii]|nr:hypothetical protein A7M48_23425 [Acinetobacter baumannii]
MKAHLRTWSGMEAMLLLLHMDSGVAFVSKTGALAVFKTANMAASLSIEISTSMPRRFISKSMVYKRNK